MTTGNVTYKITKSSNKIVSEFDRMCSHFKVCVRKYVVHFSKHTMLNGN